MDKIIFLAFCMFLFLIVIRVRIYFQQKKQNKPDASIPISDEPEIVKFRRERREKRTKLFTIIMLIVFIPLFVLMIPMIIRDISNFDYINKIDFALKCIIFLFAAYIYILGVIRVFGQKNTK